MGSGATGLAGRYASALYALAVESKKIDTIQMSLVRLPNTSKLAPI